MRKRLISIIVSVLLGFCGLFTAGCGEIGIDETKTQLYIGLRLGALGEDFLHRIGDMFEEEYKDVEFTPGKTGVEVIVQAGTNELKDEVLAANMPASGIDVYMVEDIAYSKLVSRKLAIDITDIMTEKYDTCDLGNGVQTYSIADKLSESERNYFGVDSNGETKYYSLHWWNPVHGVIYDVDLFNEYNLYFTQDGQIGGNLDDNPADLSLGVDGVAGTYDDGLPATWEEFKLLIATMRGPDYNITPFTWDGANLYQRAYFFESVWQAYEGLYNYSLNYNFNGNYNGTQITAENGYELAGQQGKKAALTAISDIVSNNKNYSNKAFLSSHTNKSAQKEFLMSSYLNKPIAMLIESSYWENEAKLYFDEMASEYGRQWRQHSRRFGYMPIPKFIGTSGVADQINDEYVVNTTNNSLIFGNAYSKKTALIKEFIKFFFRNDTLSKFTSITGVTSSCKQKVSDTDYNKMTYYQQQNYLVMQNSVTADKNLLNVKYANMHSTYLKYWSREIMCEGLFYKDLFKSIADSYQSGKPLTVEKLYNSYSAYYTASSWGENFR